jgi:plastocyanin
VTLGTRILAAQALTIAALVMTAACGGSSPTSPGSGSGSGSGSGTVGSTGSVGTVGATITISASGAVSPSQVTVAVGQSVTFINNDTSSHNMESDPHPAHTDCPSIANVGSLQAGQSKTTFGFAAAGSCGFHDHNNPNTQSLKGRIVIQ